MKVHDLAISVENIGLFDLIWFDKPTYIRFTAEPTEPLEPTYKVYMSTSTATNSTGWKIVTFLMVDYFTK